LEQAPQQASSSLPADLKALHAELEELARRVKPQEPTGEEIRPPTILV
jgi:hypothetical protein